MNEDAHKEQTAVPVMASAATGGNSFIKRELNGASFLSLEHVAHMVLVVVVTGLLAAGVTTALSLWTGPAAGVSTFSMLDMVLGGRMLEATMAIGLVAALVVLVPALVMFDRRTRAEWGKRPGFANRLAYKVPVYGALALLAAGKILAVITMLTVILSSLVTLGVSGTDLGSMYLHQFLPALLTAVIFGGAWWYVFKLAKGNDMGKSFSMAVTVLASALAIALVITAAVMLHSTPSASPMGPGTNYLNNYNNNNSGNLQDLFNY